MITIAKEEESETLTRFDRNLSTKIASGQKIKDNWKIKKKQTNHIRLIQ